MTNGRPTRREIAAAATRAEILRAARMLFTEHGYANTSIQHIAEESGAAVQTIYSSVGAKSALLLALNDLIDEEADVAGLAAELVEERRPAQLVAKSVHLTRQLNERCGDLIRMLLSAEPSEPDVAAALADGMRRHSQGSERVAAGLAQHGALRGDLSPRQAAAAMSMMTSPSSWQQLTQGAGWSFDEAERWLTESLIQLLLRRGR